jgi:hypothetical protein
MVYNGIRISGDSTSLKIENPNGGGVTLNGCLFSSDLESASFLIFSEETHGVRVGDGIIKDSLEAAAPKKPATTYKFGRNDPCACDSGKKYKNCCSPKYDFTL